jgi:hypothetical protein
MTNSQTEIGNEALSHQEAAVTGANRRTLEAIFRHPSTHNLEWSHVVALIEKIGAVDEKANNEFMFAVSGEHHMLHKPHTKDMTGSEVIDLRQLLSKAGWSAKGSSQVAADSVPAVAGIMIVVDHHEAKIYQIDVSSGDMSKHEIKPYDPHHFLHHLTHKDQSHERGQRAPEDPTFYERIAQAVATGGDIVVVGHGEGKSNAANHLTAYLRLHHTETYKRIVREVVADLSSITQPQLLEIARQALG